MWQMGAISPGQIERYHEKYAEFRNSVRDFFSRLHERVTLLGTAVGVRYSVENESGVAAEGLRIEFDVESDVSLLAQREDLTFGADDLFQLPRPPDNPEQSFMNSIRRSGLNLPSLHEHMRPRDPIAFYWIIRPRLGATHSALQCQEFRATRRFEDEIFVMREGRSPRTVDLRLNVSATNLPAPIELSAKVVIVEKAVGWSDPTVRSILPDDLVPL
jgi:hypothetical protein